MAGEIIRPSALTTERTSPVASEWMVTDNGSTVAKVTIQKAVEAGRPAASQAEAEAGVDASKAMTPLATKQAIQAQGDVRFASAAQGALADSAVQPGDLATVATTGDYDDLLNKPVIPPGLADGNKGDITVSGGGASWTLNADSVTEAALAVALAQTMAPAAPTRAALKALSVTRYNTALLGEAGRQGLFIFMAGDYSAQVTADTMEGIYVAPASDATGASGAWVRVYTDCWMLSWFGASTSRNDNQVCVAAALDLIGNGGRLYVDQVYPINGPIGWGNGSNSQQSTKHHGVHIFGKTFGASADVTSIAQNMGSGFKWVGSLSLGQGMLVFSGPIHGVKLTDIMLDGNDLVDTGIFGNHLYQFDFTRVLVKQILEAAYYFTTRTGFVSGVSYGCCEGRIISCYSYDPANHAAHGIVMTSGVSTGSPLSGNPDTCRIQVIGGTYFYGGDAGSYGALLSGADNNKFYGPMFLPVGGSSGGFDIWLQQWPGEGIFPHENVFEIYGTRGISGNGGVGSDGQNTVVNFQTGDGAPVPSLPNLQVTTQGGETYVGGKRTRRSRDPKTTVSSTPRSTSSNTFVDVPDYSISVTTKSTMLKVSAFAAVSKATAGFGDITVAIDGINVAECEARITANGVANPYSSFYLASVTAGNHTITLRSKSTDGNNVTVARGSLIVEELF